jgi:mannan endo-1,4-beta-mannosidase
MFITDKENPSNNWFVQQENKIIQDTKDAYNKGIINTFCWHLREPYNENSFYASDMTDSQKSDAFKSLLPGGKFNDWYKKKLDKVASIVSNLKDNNGKQIPIIFVLSMNLMEIGFGGELIIAPQKNISQFTDLQ